MALNYAGQPIPGIHESVDLDPPDNHVVRTHYPGLDGVTEVRLGSGGRYIRYYAILFDRSFTSAADVTNLLRKFDTKIGVSGTLRESGNINRVFNNCVFEGCKSLHAPIPDISRSLVRGIVVFHTRAILTWYQLSLKDD